MLHTDGTLTVGWSTLSNTVNRKSPAAYRASVSANAAARRFSPIAVFVSTIFFRICLRPVTINGLFTWQQQHGGCLPLASSSKILPLEGVTCHRW